MWGQLGDGTTITRPAPVQVPISDVKAIFAGVDATYAIKNDGTVWAWGRNDYGQLGDGTNVSSYTPVQVKGLTNVKSIAEGAGNVLALKEDGTVWAWGRDTMGELGIASINSTNAIDNNGTYDLYYPSRVPITDVVQIGCGAFHCVALKSDGTVWSWGGGSDGALGYGGLDDQYAPVQVPITNVKEIACGYSDTFALKNDGTIWGWGDNFNYCLGNKTINEYQSTPVRAKGIDNVISISAGGQHTIVLRSDGTVWGWGLFPSLGNGSNGITNGGYYIISVIDPVMVNGLAGVTSISAGYAHSLALKDDGTVWAWGSNHEGQLGDGEILNTLETLEPAPVQAYVGTQTGPAHVHVPLAMLSSTATPVPGQNSTAAPINTSVKLTEKWNIQNMGALDHLGIGDEGLLYAFANNTITCIGQDGAPRWNVTIPDKWSICNDWERIMSLDISGSAYHIVTSQPIYATDGGNLYVYATPGSSQPEANTSGWDILAITPDGHIAWDRPLNKDASITDSTSIKALNGRVYVFYDYSETVLDKNGSILFTVPNVSDPAAIDENGCLYTSEAARVNWHISYIGDAGHSDLRVASGVIKAYSPSGELLWQKDMGGIIPVQYTVEEVRQKYGTMPLYQDGTVYVPISNGVVALDRNGNEKWSKHFDRDGFTFFDLMPIDVADNVYLACYNLSVKSAGRAMDIYMIDRNGTLVAPPRTLDIYYDGIRHSSAKDGIIYNLGVQWNIANPLQRLDDLDTITVSAYDIKDDRYLWSYTVPTDPRYSAVVNASNIYTMMDRSSADQFVSSNGSNNNSIQPGINGFSEITTYPTGDALYINFRSIRYESPLVMTKSRCVYTSGIYALDTSAYVIFQKPLDTAVTTIAVNNSTIYYGTSAGGISAISVGLTAGGITLAAALVFVVGYIARSRIRSVKNQNRTSVLEYIIQNPGTTLNEISRGMGMNAGTIRYHIFILGLNHRIATFKDDNKYIRYFPNSNRYSKEEQLLISMIRRDTIKRVIQLLFMKPGLTNVEISSVTGLADSGVSRYLRELCEKGVASKSEVTPGRYAYSLTDGASKIMEKLYWMINGDSKAQTWTADIDKVY